MRRSPPLASKSIVSFGVGESGDVTIGVVIPVFRHSVFLADAVASVLHQETNFGVGIVIVDDGCPHSETKRIATTLAFAYPGKVEYVRRTNGGLSAARNTGINYALGRWPSLKAVYFLDADNIIEPKALERAYLQLSADTSLGWVYPDVIYFGMSNQYYDYSGPHSALRHLADNLSEAGSLVRREVFERGCWFDESMRLGYEDWEFWWQCIDAGFKGAHVPFFGLRYRKRPESMLSEAERDNDAVVSYMRRKHRHLLRAKSLLSLEALEKPRYAILYRASVFKICNDPRGTGDERSDNEVFAQFVAAWAEPHLCRAPRYLVVGSESGLAALAAARLDRYVLWWLELQFATGHDRQAAGVQIVAVPAGSEIILRQMDTGYWPIDEGGVHIMAMKDRTLLECVVDPGESWVRSLLDSEPRPKTSVLRIELPEQVLPVLSFPNVVSTWYDTFHKLRDAARRPIGSIARVKPRTIPPCASAFAVPSQILKCGPVFPFPTDGGLDIVFVLSLVSFGGVEKVALNVAEQFRALGWRCHLLVCSSRGRLDERWLAVFESLQFYDDERFQQLGNDQQFLGTNYPRWSTDGDSREVEGLLLAANAVINFHSSVLHRVMSKLRSAGVVTIASLHLNGSSPLGREVGHAFLALGYEHVYDVLAPCSKMLLDWCHAMGAPRDKLLLVPNAPAHGIGAEEIVQVLARRRARRSSQSGLNALFLGRLDRQKGVDRLAAIIRKSRNDGLPVSWRIVGGPVLECGDRGLLREIADLIEPALFDPPALAEIYEWADVLIIPSLWEGLPLTILEAAQLGVVPIVSRVGAVEEAVTHGLNGIIIDDEPFDSFVAATVDALTKLAFDKELLAQLSDNSAAMMTRNWEESCRALVERVEEIVKKNSERDLPLSFSSR